MTAPNQRPNDIEPVLDFDSVPVCRLAQFLLDNMPRILCFFENPDEYQSLQKFTDWLVEQFGDYFPATALEALGNLHHDDWLEVLNNCTRGLLLFTGRNYNQCIIVRARVLPTELLRRETRTAISSGRDATRAAFRKKVGYEEEALVNEAIRRSLERESWSGDEEEDDSDIEYTGPRGEHFAERAEYRQQLDRHDRWNTFRREDLESRRRTPRAPFPHDPAVSRRRPTFHEEKRGSYRNGPSGPNLERNFDSLASRRVSQTGPRDLGDDHRAGRAFRNDSLNAHIPPREHPAGRNIDASHDSRDARGSEARRDDRLRVASSMTPPREHPTEQPEIGNSESQVDPKSCESAAPILTPGKQQQFDLFVAKIDRAAEIERERNRIKAIPPFVPRKTHQNADIQPTPSWSPFTPRNFGIFPTATPSQEDHQEHRADCEQERVRERERINAIKPFVPRSQTPNPEHQLSTLPPSNARSEENGPSPDALDLPRIGETLVFVTDSLIPANGGMIDIVQKRWVYTSISTKVCSICEHRIFNDHETIGCSNCKIEFHKKCHWRAKACSICHCPLCLKMFDE